VFVEGGKLALFLFLDVFGNFREGFNWHRVGCFRSKVTALAFNYMRQTRESLEGQIKWVCEFSEISRDHGERVF
jgi:hypothetical protein